MPRHWQHLKRVHQPFLTPFVSKMSDAGREYSACLTEQDNNYPILLVDIDRLPDLLTQFRSWIVRSRRLYNSCPLHRSDIGRVGSQGAAWWGRSLNFLSRLLRGELLLEHLHAFSQRSNQRTNFVRDH